MNNPFSYTSAFVFFFFVVFSCFPSSAQQAGDIRFKDNPDAIVLFNEKATFRVDKATLKIEVLDPEGEVHFAEYNPPSFRVNDEWILPEGDIIVGDVSNGSVVLEVGGSGGSTIQLSVAWAGDSGFKIRYHLPDAQVSEIAGVVRLHPVEEIFGFGETWNEEVAQRGEAIEIWDKGGTPDECAWMPYFVSTNNYAFFLDYGGLVKFDVGRRKVDELTYRLPANELAYTVVLGEDVASTVKNYIALTGMPSKPPRWSFEPWFWLMSDPDMPGAELSTLKGEHFLEMVAKLKELDIPVGVTWLEPPWQDARTTFIPDKEFSPDLKKLISDLDAEGVKTLAWTVPYTSPGASNWKEAVENGYLVRKPGGGADNRKIKISTSGELEGTFYNYIDFYNPDAFRWWQQQIEKSVDLGIKGFKLDDGQGLASDGVLHGGLRGKDVDNAYALEYNRVFYNSLKKKLGDDFLMIPRAAFIGSTSFTNFKWPGDLSGSFAANGLPSSVYSSLSLALSGMPFVSTDIGGFAHKPAPEEAWIRWAQFGAMLPGMQTLHMPWWYSDDAVKHYRYLAWLHTDLIPYWQSLAYEASETGAPICRPLVWNYQDDQETWHVDDEFTVGDYLLVAPFMNPERMRDVYLPEGKWFDFWDDKEILDGGKKVRWFKGWKPSLYKFPLYIKEGATIPMEIENDVSGFGSSHSKGFVTLAMWPETDAENKFILQDREGKVPFVTNWQNPGVISVTWENSSQDYLFRIHIQGGDTPQSVVAQGNHVRHFKDETAFRESETDGWYFDRDTRKLWVKKFNKKNSGLIEVKLNSGLSR